MPPGIHSEQGGFSPTWYSHLGDGPGGGEEGPLTKTLGLKGGSFFFFFFFFFFFLSFLFCLVLFFFSFLLFSF